MEFYKRNRNSIFIFLLFFISYAIRLYYLPSIPIYGDEAAYAEIIDELNRTPSLLPHFMGHIVSWKPTFGFAVYSAIINIIWMLNPRIPLEVAYRFPSIIFGVLSTLALYFLVRKLYGEELAFLSSLIFTTNCISIAISEALLLDTLVLFLLISGVLFYAEGERNKKYFYYGGLAGALLFLTKSIIALLLPALAISYYVGDRRIGREVSRGKAFLLSLSAVPLAMLLYALLFFLHAPLGKGADITVSYVYDIFFRVYAHTNFEPHLLQNTIEFLKLTAPWCILFFSGVMLMKFNKREDRFIFIWLLLTLVFLGAGQFYSWYYLQALPPFSVVCAKPLVEVKNKRFFIPAFLLLLLLSFPSIANSDFMNSYLYPFQINAEKMETGVFLRDRYDVLSITENGIPEVVFYKFHGENKPNYSGFQMIVLDPFGIASYTAYPTLSEIAMGRVHKRNLTDAGEVKLLINNSKYVVMDSKVYGIYSSSPSHNYSLILNSSQGSYVILEKTK
ncbi:MAG: glycosyltransferase family 39 protein [Candidatus Micrarchaeia archaeon]